MEPHRATSDVLAVAYPFLAEEGLGSSGVLIGVDYWSGTAFVFDPWVLYDRKVLTNPNILLAGQIGRGKSMLAKSLACRQIAFGRRVYVCGDVKGEWSVVADAVGGAVIRLAVGSSSRLNPLDEGPRPSGMSDIRPVVCPGNEAAADIAGRAGRGDARSPLWGRWNVRRSRRRWTRRPRRPWRSSLG